MTTQIQQNIDFVVYAPKDEADYDATYDALREKGFRPFGITGYRENTPKRGPTYLTFSPTMSGGKRVFTDGDAAGGPLPSGTQVIDSSDGFIQALDSFDFSSSETLSPDEALKALIGKILNS